MPMEPEVVVEVVEEIREGLRIAAATPAEEEAGVAVAA